MFGYVTADTRRLSKKQKADYKKHYCGLCNALSENYGARSRFLLSFDTAFLFTVLSGIDESDDGNCRCPYSVFKKCQTANGKHADYCADITVILSYLKLQDDIDDNGSFKAKVLQKLFKKQYQKACLRQSEIADKIKNGLCALSDAEKNGETNADITANIFGDILGQVFAVKKELYDFGFYLGKFIYLADAACDFKSDLKHKRYNPLVSYRKRDFYPMLLHCMAQCCECYKKLDIKKYRDIIENVLYHGVWLKPTLKGINDDRPV